MKYLFILLLISFSTGMVSGQTTGTIAGKVTNEGTGMAMNAATVTITSLNKGTATDLDGRFVFQVVPGIYILEVQSIGFAPKSISEVIVMAGQTTELNVSLQTQSTKMEGIVITSSARKETVNSVLAMQRNNASISDGISMEAIRKSPDRNIGEVLKRVSGTSIQDNKFVVIRGLSDRYNVSLINGAILPSTEPDRRSFSFDVIPSHLIDNILINKTASPDMPGDFSGGVVQVLTKDIPFRSFFNISVGTSYNSISTGNRFDIGLLESSDYLAFDNGTRALPEKFPSRNRYAGYNGDATPERRIAASRLMRNNYGSRYDGNALPGFNFQLNGGARKDLKKGGTLGAVLALNYRNAQNIQPGFRRDYQSLGRDQYSFDYIDTTYSFTTNIGALANLAWKKGGHKIVWKNLANRLFDNNHLVRSGDNYDALQHVKATGSIANIKSLVSSQLEGEHVLGKKADRLKWNLNYAFTSQEQPDYRVLPYSVHLDDKNNKQVPFQVVLRDTYRFWSNLMENAFGIKLDYSIPLKFGEKKQIFKAGAFSQIKIRDFSTRIFRYEQASSIINPAILTLPPRQIFNDGNIYEEGFVLGEVTNNTDKYDASSGLYAAYAMIDGRISDNLRAVYGVRIEHFGFDVNTADFSGAKVHLRKSYLDILPSINLTYDLNPAQKLRFSVSRTVSRPELREVANFSYYDFIRNAQITGNTELERSQNTNLDLRFEIYPNSGEIISASLFYKHFSKPIEQAVVPGSAANSLRFTFMNPESAQSAGVEFEVRKRLGFIGISPWMNNLTFNFNGALIQSEVKLKEGDNFWNRNRPMQGQSPWLVNAGLQYTTDNNKLSFSTLVNRIGERVIYVGSQDYPDVYENGRTMIDLQAAIKVLKNAGELKLNVSDLLSQQLVYYQNLDGRGAYKASADRVQTGAWFGRSVSISFTYQLK